MIKQLLLLTFFLILGLTTAFPGRSKFRETSSRCGYESCHPTKDDMVNVHIVPHTHDDVGWLKTVDQYYYGSNTSIQNAGVQYILDSVLDELKKDSNRRFIYVETAYLWKWYKQQHDVVKHKFKNYLINGQLELIGGGWSMNDEAVTHYQSIIDQFTWGLRKLNDTFGKCGRPKVGWQIDPFGHSKEMASIFAQLGFDGLLLGRIDYQDKNLRFKSKTPEMVWQGSDSLGNNSQLFTSVMYNTYSPPPGFCFDILCSDQPIIDDKRSPDYNVDSRVNDFLDYVKNVTAVYNTNNVIITMGEDFTYQDAHVWFKNIDKLITYTNKLQLQGSKYNLIYSTPSCYLKAVHDESRKFKISYPLKTDDFFPYASDSHSYWSGYFTSKPTIKRYERLGNNFLQVCKQQYALADLGPEDWADLNVLREAMGVMQHHDAITGTEKQHVAHDYERILSLGMDECSFAAASALSKIAKISSDERPLDPTPDIPFTSCFLANVSQCALTESSNDFVVTVYNPLSRPVNQFVRFPVLHNNYDVRDSENRKSVVQMVPIPESIQKVPGRNSSATVELVFLATGIPPLGFKSYYVKKLDGEPPSFNNQTDYQDIGISINPTTGLIANVVVQGQVIPLEQNFFYYRGAVGDNEESKNRSSGAYIFRPNGTETHVINEKPSYKIIKGPLLIEVQQTFGDWLSQTIRIYKYENFVEFDWLVGPIPEDDVNGKEIITKFKTSLKSESIFYTDANGREVLKRVRNFRPTWKLNLTEPVASNYYPVTSKILIRDPKQDLEVAVLTDRAQGGTSLKDGEIELMIHRNCLHDDAFGVGEALQEKAFGVGLVARGSHFLLAGPFLKTTAQTLAAQEKDLAQRKLLSTWTFVSPTKGLSFADYRAKYRMKYSGLKRSLPNNVQILTLEPWKSTSLLLRLEHVFEKNEDPVLSKPATVDLKGLFAPFEVSSIRETTLGANQWLNENRKFRFNVSSTLEDVAFEQKVNADAQNLWDEGWIKWINNQRETNDIEQFINDTDESSTEEFEQQSDDLLDDLQVDLKPMQIRTFVVDIKRH